VAVGTLHHPGDTVVHRLPAEVKVAATLAFAFAVVLTPRTALGAFAVDAALVLGVVAVAGLPPAQVARRLRIELPFLAFALFLPLVGDSWWSTWNIVAKGTLGVLAAIVLSSTTPVVELLAGLERLRVPRGLTAVAGFMVRYLDVIVGEADRMRIARLSRGDDPRWLWQARGVAASAGTLFVRSYERGERVHLAMMSRGCDNELPRLHHHAPPPATAWLLAATVPLVATTAALVAHAA
jgi:cobalt/nickel transport system permease protein